MQNVSQTLADVDNSTVPQNRCCGHRRSSSLPVGPISAGQTTNTKGKQNAEKNFGDLNGLVDTLNQISESLSRPAKSLLEFLNQKNANLEKFQDKQKDASDGFSTDEKVQTALKQINTIQANLKHVLPHMEDVLTDYKTMKERTQSREEMLKTLDKALRHSEGQSRTFRNQLQDMRDENKCLKEKAQQNESILRYLEKGREEMSGEKRNKRDKEDGVSKRVDTTTKGVVDVKGKSRGVGDIRIAGSKRSDLVTEKSSDLVTGNIRQYPKEELGNQDLRTKLHLQKVLRDYENQLQEVVQLNKELVLKVNETESEVMNANRDIFKHQETLAIYENGFKNLTKGNSEMDAMLREERAKNIQLKEKLEDSEGYINCITDKVASYEVELKYLRQKLRTRDEKTTT